MKKTLLVIGDRYRRVDELNECIKRRAESILGEIDSIVYLRESDPDILFEIQKLIEKSERLAIMCSKMSMPLISKTLATHSNDTIIVKNDTLIPSKAKLLGKSEFALVIGATEIIALLAEEKTIFALSDEGGFCLFGQDEESAKLLIAPLATAHDVSFSIYAHCGGWLQGKTKANRYGNTESFLQNLAKLFGNSFSIGDDAVAVIYKHIGNQSMCVAESCTGGLLAHRFTQVAGASKNFLGGFITYANEAKSAWLGVLPATIEEFGAVSEQTLEQMLDGALQASGANYALATSGVAGPDGGTPEKPVGTVYIGLGIKNGEKIIQKLALNGDRAWIQSCASWHATRLLAEFLLKSK